MFNAPNSGNRWKTTIHHGQVYLVNTSTLPNPGTHYFTSRKLLKGFEYLGYRYSETCGDLDKIADSPNSIVFISNHGLVGESQEVERALQFLATVKPQAVYVLWFFHSLVSRKQVPFEKWILTGEHFRKKPQYSQAYEEMWKVQQGLENYVPLTFSANVIPEKVGTFKRTSIYDAQFVGNGYKSEWTSRLKDCYIRNTPPFISEKERIQSYLESHVSLGFHSEANIQNHCVVERIFEGMAYGCVVLSDNPTAEEITDGIVEYVGNFERLVDKIDFYKHDEQARIEKQIRGYQYVRDKGCYVHVARQFLEKISLLGFI
jgi:hypothetical protein